MRSGIIQLNGFDTTEVIMVPRILRVCCRCRKVRLGNKLVCLVVEVVVQVAAQKAVDERSLSFVVVAEGGSPLSGEEKADKEGKDEMKRVDVPEMLTVWHRRARQ